MRRISPLLVPVLIIAAGVWAGGCRKKSDAPPARSRKTATAPRATTKPVKVVVGEAATAKAPAPLKVTERIDAGRAVTVARLENGLTVIVKPTYAAPVVCVKAYVHAGGLHEGMWLGCGLSHLTEHLVAEDATHSHDGQQAAQKKTENRVTAIGGQSNASTSLNWTQYYISAAASKTGECIDLIADWMARPHITQEAFDREHGVVQRELEMRLDDPNRQLWRSHAAVVFREHPAAVPVIGYQAPLQKLSRADVLAYIAKMYVPQNMIFCVVGDVDAAEVLDRTCKAFAGFHASTAPDLSLPPVRPWTGVRRSVRTHKDVKQTAVALSFQTIPLVHEDLYALDVLSYVLTNGQASRLVRKLQREAKLVTSISSFSWTPSWGTGEFRFSYRCDPSKAAAAEQVLLAELKRVIAEGVTDDELHRAKRQKVADFVYSQQTAESVAATLATDYMTTGDVAFSRHYTDRIQSVTAGQVRAMAHKYFTFDRMVMTRLVPETKPTTTAPSSRPSQIRRKATLAKLDNGLEVVLFPNDAVGLVSMTYAVRGGLLAEDDKTNGLGSLMTALSTRGAGHRSAEEIARFFDAAGGGVGGNCGNNTFYWQATVLDDSFNEALPIFADVVFRPTFDQKELDILRPRALAAIKQIDEDYRSQLDRFFRRKFYGSGPYGRLTVGSEAVVTAVTTEQIRAHHRGAVLGNRGVLAIYGNFDAAKTLKAVEKLFGTVSLKAGATTRPAVPPRRVDPTGELYVKQTTNEVACVIVAVPGMTVYDEDRFAVAVLDTIISGYRLPTGWLHEELRGKGLVYAVHAYNWAGLEPGAFMIEATCQPDKAGQVLKIVRKNMKKATGYLPAQKEVDRAVNVILTAMLLNSQSMADLSMTASLDQLYGFGYDYRRKLEALYRKVTPADVRRVAQKYLTQPQVVAVSTPRPDVLKQDGP